jgi:hypothetical protein
VVVHDVPKSHRADALPWLSLTYPACGTVGCIAGWTTTLKGQRLRSERSISRTAGRLLGLTSKQREELFVPYHIIDGTDAQTPLHAEATVAHIRTFQKTYAKQLRAKAV